MFHDLINDDIYIDQDESPKFFQVIRFTGDNLAEIKMMFPEYDCDAGVLSEEWVSHMPITYGLSNIDLTQTYCLLDDGLDVHTVPVGGYFARCIGEWKCHPIDRNDSISEYNFVCSLADEEHLNSIFTERSAYIEHLMRATTDAWNKYAKK